MLNIAVTRSGLDPPLAEVVANLGAVTRTGGQINDDAY